MTLALGQEETSSFLSGAWHQQRQHKKGFPFSSHTRLSTHPCNAPPTSTYLDILFVFISKSALGLSLLSCAQTWHSGNLLSNGQESPEGDRQRDVSWSRRRLWLQPLLGRHRDELRSLLAQSSWLVMSPFPITPQVLLFFLRWVMASPSEPESAFRKKGQMQDCKHLVCTWKYPHWDAMHTK